jgi:hypothetical protein
MEYFLFDVERSHWKTMSWTVLSIISLVVNVCSFCIDMPQLQIQESSQPRNSQGCLDKSRRPCNFVIAVTNRKQVDGNVRHHKIFVQF